MPVPSGGATPVAAAADVPFDHIPGLTVTMTVLNAVAVSVKMPVVKQGTCPEGLKSGLESHGSPLSFFLQMISPVNMLMMLISMLMSPPEETVCVTVVKWSTIGETVPTCGGAVMAG